MAALRLAVVFVAAFMFVANAQQIFYDIGSQLDTLNLPGIIIPDTIGQATVRKSCYDGTEFYYTIGDSIYDSTSTLIVVAPGLIDSLACGCNVLAYSYVTGTFPALTTSVRILSANGVTVQQDVGNVLPVALDISRSNDKRYLIVVARQTLIIYDADDLAGSPVFQGVLDLPGIPMCVAGYVRDTIPGVDIFVTYGAATTQNIVSWDGSSATVTTTTDISVYLAGRFGPEIENVYCVDVADDMVYFLISGNGIDFELSEYPIAGWLAGTQSLRDGVIIAVSGGNGALESDVNGLTVCDTICQAARTTCNDNCACGADLCGFCYGEGSGACQCTDSFHPRCTYEDTTLGNTCFDPVPLLDGCCMVLNPVANRRSGGPITVVGVSTIESTFNVDRLAPTGRWTRLPISDPVAFNAGGSLFVDGFSANVPTVGRGRRFGVYNVDVSPLDGSIPVMIPCIATENSGFTNSLHTVTVSQGETAILQAVFVSTRLNRFQSALRWRRTEFDPLNGNMVRVDIPQCNGQLSCNVAPSQLVEGIYECYRLGRSLRTWHPLFYLFVRGCGPFNFGPACTGVCPVNCGNGICDDLTGLCNCYPGFSGQFCDTACNAGELGQTCSFTCNDVFAGSNCNSVQICKPGKVGCRCYPGLQPPDCQLNCATGTWGSNCENTCAGATCDPRTGV